LDILTRGIRRFEVVGLNEEKSYLRGEVEYFDDEEQEPPPAELQQKALTHYRGLLETGELRSSTDPVLTDPQLSFQLAQALQDVDFLSLLLRNRSEVDRLKQLAEYLSRELPKLREASRMKRLAPLNGHGTKPPGL